MRNKAGKKIILTVGILSIVIIFFLKTSIIDLAFMGDFKQNGKAMKVPDEPQVSYNSKRLPASDTSKVNQTQSNLSGSKSVSSLLEVLRSKKSNSDWQITVSGEEPESIQVFGGRLELKGSLAKQTVRDLGTIIGNSLASGVGVDNVVADPIETDSLATYHVPFEYNGYEIYNQGLTVVADKTKGTLAILQFNQFTLSNVGNSPQLSKSEVIQLLKNQYLDRNPKITVSEAPLIYLRPASPGIYIWEATIELNHPEDSRVALLNAEDGKVLYSFSTVIQENQEKLAY